MSERVFSAITIFYQNFNQFCRFLWVFPIFCCVLSVRFSSRAAHSNVSIFAIPARGAIAKNTAKTKEKSIFSRSRSFSNFWRKLIFGAFSPSRCSEKLRFFRLAWQVFFGVDFSSIFVAFGLHFGTQIVPRWLLEGYQKKQWFLRPYFTDFSWFWDLPGDPKTLQKRENAGCRSPIGASFFELLASNAAESLAGVQYGPQIISNWWKIYPKLTQNLWKIYQQMLENRQYTLPILLQKSKQPLWATPLAGPSS